MFGRHRARRAVLTMALTAAAVVIPQLPTGTAGASVFPAEGGTVYKEYWLPHANWTGGCPEWGLYKPGDAWYIEPGPCVKRVTFNIPDNVSRVAKVEVYLDLWRNYTGIKAARFKLNNGPVRQPPAGLDWSRTPVVMQIPVGELKQGTNTLELSSSPSGRRWHLHDVSFRVYHTPANPLVAGPGSDVTPPEVSLTSVGGLAPGAGGTLQVSNDQLNLAANSTGAKFVEFHALYDGYDTDNDGVFKDWQGFSRNNWNDGGAKTKPVRPSHGSSTVGIPGVDATAPYAVTWNLPHVISQTGVKFKARAVDAAGNVRETPASAAFSLARTYPTSKHLIPNFVDIPIHIDGFKPPTATVTINLPALTGMKSAFLVGHYWQNPNIKINGNAVFKAFDDGEDVWQTSVQAIPIGWLRAGSNTITYSYNPMQIRYGQFVEKPGPMIVLRGATTSVQPTSEGAGDAGPADDEIDIRISAD